MIVVDASVLCEHLLGRAEIVDALAEALGPTEALHAPELIEPETLGALRGLTRGGAISEARAEQAVADMADLRLMRHPHAPLREGVWELRHALTSYDATYLALAEALADSVLMTADGGLATVATDRLGSERVRAFRL